MNHWSDALVNLRACKDAVAWAKTQPDPETAWQRCERGDWMLWLVGKLAGPPGSDSRRPLVLAACACARLELPYVPNGENRPLRAIETAEAWALGGKDAPSLDDVRKSAGYSADAAAAAAYSAYSAEVAAYSADAAAAAAAYSAYAAAAAAAAAYSAYSARAGILKKCAMEVRKIYPHAPELP